ncbi:MAG: anaerobic glycerol-3-phosphate dehydrogenase subunit C [Selenomonadaceae bacterium]|nr:anaerobic glycerol-3-phosphate dehydrogenase subunit C [Selenomonadaceae bacterium]
MKKEIAALTGDYCLSCTACMANCPVMAAAKEYRGPKLVGPAHGRMHFSQEDVEDSLEFCSNCKNCDRACPSGVAVSTLNMLARAKYFETHEHTHSENILAHTERMAKLVRKIPFGATFANLGMSVGKIFGIFKMIGIAGERDMPRYASMPFRKKFRDIVQKPADKKVVLFTGCYINDNEPQVGDAFVKVMQANGYEVLIDEEFNCCGSPLVAMGFFDEAREHASNNVRRILEWKKKNIPVVTPCTSCSLMLKEEYHELFDEEKIFEAATNVYDAFEFLDILDERGELNRNFKPLDKTFLYHVPCHLKSQAIGLPAAEILEEINGVKVKLADAGCCGISGNYGFRKDRYEISMKVGEKLFKRIARKDFDEIISDCGTCRMQINHATKIQPVHPLEILARVNF